MKRRFKSIKNRIMVFFIGVAVFQIAAMALFAVFHLRPSLTKMYEEHLEKFTESAFWEVTSAKMKIENYTVNMIGDSDIQEFLESADNSSRNYVPSMTAEMRNRILSYTDYDSAIRSIYLIDNFGRMYSNLSHKAISGYLESKEELRKRSDASAVWFTDFNDSSIVVYRIVNNNTTDLKRKIGAICMVIDKSLFVDRIQQLLLEDTQNYRLESADGNFRISSAADRDTFSAEKYIISSYDNRIWRLETWIDKDEAYASIYLIFKILTLELMVLLVISICMVIYLSGRITRPISDIRNAMKQIGKGNMEAEVPVSGEDEIGQLAATMNRMSKKIGELVERIRREETNQRLLELKAMQYQINPHFLYNTLDSISMFARKNHDEQCEELVIALSDFFRISLSHGQEFVTVEKEVKYAECYLEIQNIRFPEQITWDVTVEEELKEIKIMKFILQPLVENSIYHGIRDAGRKGHIQISAYQDANGLILCVQDDGIGMLPEELTELMADLESEEIREKDIHEGGFGLKNVHQRLKLMYGENSGLQIKSEWEEGTCITIYIPYKSGFSRQALDLSMDGDAS
ncbi:histidine kinase [Muricomes sp. OA1]|uniref:histidine kinase n=1 Tax=Hungatella hathewayi TaxID=154046 RepID=A0A3E2WIH2_9FIRM|nr:MULTISPECIES: histidine kinase [Clostridia]MCH1973154.1 histidine kinase [Muricomes sp. OA1]MRM90402.1 HAMP domain-containing protein [Faecalicatena contorta]RGC26872.1 HAMP domain-containing protein [Hungatella hathewayi]GKH31935.1 sensor histidine kinase YesM [Faecalicatena contorta]